MIFTFQTITIIICKNSLVNLETSMKDTPKIPIDTQFWRGILAILCVALIAHGLIAFLVFTADLAVHVE